MPDDFRSPAPDDFAPRVRTTFGEVLPDGTTLELVTVGDQVMLLHWDGVRQLVQPFFDSDNIVYTPPRLDPSLAAAIRFPGPPVEYGNLGTLFDDLARVFEQWRFSREVGQCCGLFVLASWFSEFFFDPPTLIVNGPEMRQAAVLFAVLACLCRRSFRAAQFDRSLPFRVKPTLLVLAPDTSGRRSAFWRAANIRGVRVPSRTGTVDDLACTRVLFMNDPQAVASWGGEALHLSLFPYAQLRPPTEQEMTEIANEFQPKLLMFRLQQLVQTNRTSVPPETQKQFTKYEFSRQLITLVRGEPGIIASITPLIEVQQRDFQEYQQRNPHRAVIEALWSPSHTEKEISMKELSKRVNALLRSRNETIEFDLRDIGWKMRQLGLPRQRNRDGMFVQLSRDLCRQVHQLARNFGLKLPRFKDCSDCN